MIWNGPVGQSLYTLNLPTFCVRAAPGASDWIISRDDRFGIVL
jgi:hypothetical protein